MRHPADILPVPLERDSPQMIRRSSLLAFGFLVAGAAPAATEECAIVDLARIGEAKVCVSSVLPPVRGITYGPELMFDGNPKTAWTENV
ncbi:MAG: hypothetical protein MJA32_01715, partial [Proteobacteria bacterium]|nr:hypothetical protein [Pseudomonadota bacterium]